MIWGGLPLRALANRTTNKHACMNHSSWFPWYIGLQLSNVMLLAQENNYEIHKYIGVTSSSFLHDHANLRPPKWICPHPLCPQFERQAYIHQHRNVS